MVPLLRATCSYNAAMQSRRLPLRLIALALLSVAVVLVLGLLLATVNSALELYERLQTLPFWIRWPGLAGALLVIVLALWLAWRLLRPQRGHSPRTMQAPSREQVSERIDALQRRDVLTSELQAELVELDRRRTSEQLYVAVFGEISTGKSSLIRALSGDREAQVDVLGGTTRKVTHFEARLPDGASLILADVPGSAEIDGEMREQLARDEALRAHAVVYVCATELTRGQHAELEWLLGFGKPLLLVLNKIDQYHRSQAIELRDALQARYAGRGVRVLMTSAGYQEQLERVRADGRHETLQRERPAEITQLLDALQQVSATGAAALEPARGDAVLMHVDSKARELARDAARRESQDCVARYTRRAVVGAMAAVAPGSDIIIQGALGTAMVRELARIHDVPVRELDVDQLLRRMTLTVRNTTAIVLAIAGNALKAFPGLGTLGGGVAHAVAYGLVFDSVGKAISATLAAHAALDAADAERRLRILLAEPACERIERIARIALAEARSAGTDDASR